MTAILFLDFDGTISRGDVVDSILETHAEADWLRVEEEWRAGRLGSRDCLRAQMELVRATPEEMDALLDAVELDEGFFPLLETCASRGIPVHIVSDGFDYCIQRILGRASRDGARLLQGVQVCASHLEPDGDGRWRVDFPFFRTLCPHGCATCKPAAMSWLNPIGAPSAFVGDGLSDRFAVAAAAVVFAKHALAAYCVERGILHVPYATLTDVAAHLRQMVRGATTPRSGEDADRTRGKVWAQP